MNMLLQTMSVLFSTHFCTFFFLEASFVLKMRYPEWKYVGCSKSNEIGFIAPNICVFPSF